MSICFQSLVYDLSVQERKLTGIFGGLRTQNFRLIKANYLFV